MTDFLGIPFEVLEQLIALILVIYGYWKTKQVQVLTAPNTNSTLVQKVIVPTLPAKSWKMDQWVKDWLMSSCPVQVQASILQQIADAEAAHMIKYQIKYPGGYDDIEYGMLVGGAGECGKVT